MRVIRWLPVILSLAWCSALAQEVVTLEAGKPIERQIAGGEKQAFQIALAAGEYLKATVEQRGVDVSVQALGPDNKSIVEFDSEIRKIGTETIELAAETAGLYRLIATVKQKDAPAGSYELHVIELRAATDQDRALQEARVLAATAFNLYRMGKLNEAFAPAQRSLEIREQALGPEHADVAAAVRILAILNSVKGDYAKAEPLFQRALAIREKALGPDHPSEPPVLLGRLYSMGQWTNLEGKEENKQD